MMAARGRVDDISALLHQLSLVEGEIVVLKARCIMGPEHIRSAVYHAIRSFDRAENFARTIGVETLLYLSGERQISRALRKMGLEPGDEEIAIISFGADGDAFISSLGWTRDDSLLLLDKGKEQFLLETIEGIKNIRPLDHILEKVALLDINK